MNNETKNILIASYTPYMLWYPFLRRNMNLETSFMNKEYLEDFKKNLSYKKTPNFTTFMKNNYKGGLVFSINILPYPLIIKGKNELEKFLLDKNNNKTKSSLMSASIVGALTPLYYNPIKTVVIDIQNNNSKLLTSIKNIYGTKGISSFYRGALFFSTRNIVYCNGMLAIPKYINTYLQNHNIDKNMSKISSYVIPTLLSTLISMPMDVFSSMSVSDYKKSKYKTNYEIIKTAYNTRGIKGFFIGYKYRFMATMIEFMAFNEIINYLNK
jgi:hypothetical protein